MRRTILGVAVIAVALCARAEAKCARLVLVVSGEVEGDPEGQLTVRAEARPIARTTKKSIVREGSRFEATLLFDTYKKSSRFNEDCSADPEVIEVFLLRGDKAIVTKQFSFEKDFVFDGDGRYRLREPLVLKGQS